MVKRRILCLLSHVGGAHAAIARAFEENLADELDFRTVDLFRETSRFCDGSIKLYARVLLDLPRFYNLFYSAIDRRPVWDAVYTLFIRRLMKEKTKRIILDARPDVVLSLFALTSRIAADALDELGLAETVPLAVFVVDPFTIHASWVERRTRLYLVPSLECGAFLVSRGVRKETVRAVRYPVGDRFRGEYDREGARRSLGIEESSRTVLIMGGADGVLPADRIAGLLLDGEAGLHVIAVAGKNRELLARLEAMRSRHGGRLTAVGHSDRIHELMAAADVLVTKPGPSTIMEAFERRLPILATGFVPVQERGNVDFIRSKGLGTYAAPGEMSRLLGCVRDGAWLEKVRRNMGEASGSHPTASAFEELRRLAGAGDESTTEKATEAGCGRESGRSRRRAKRGREG